MIRPLLLILCVLAFCACSDEPLPTQVEPSPSPIVAPTPQPVDDCEILQTEIVARDSKGNRVYSWAFDKDTTLEARFVFYGQREPGFTGAECTQLTSTTGWLLLPPGLCAAFGNIFSSQVIVSCLRPGTLDVSVTPTSIDGFSVPQGRAVFDIQP